MSKKNKQWQTLSKNIVHENPWFKIIKEKIKKPSGYVGNYFILRRPQKFVAIVPVTKENKLILVKQFRTTLKKIIWEFPMGGIDKKETPLDAAKRELREETGMTAEKWKKAGEFYVGPGHTDQSGLVFIAEGVKEISQSSFGADLEEGEEIFAKKAITLEKFENQTIHGKIKDGPSMTAYYLAKKHLERKKNE
jgi:8-oxo-dGTP pyrophosphatase MutT (NUDIX family)